MSRKRRARRGPSEAATAAPTTAVQEPVSELPPLPQWRWKTFPVYFAFALGGFIGVYAGYLTGYISGKPNGSNGPSLIVFAIAAVLLGFGVARIGVRGLMGWGIIRPTPQKKK